MTTTPFTSRHWPSGARFLDDLRTFMDYVAATSPEDMVGATIRAESETSSNGSTQCTVRVDILEPLGTSTGHARLRAEGLLTTLPARLAQFVQEAAALPGVAKQGRIPTLHLTVTGQRAQPVEGMLLLTGANRVAPKVRTVAAGTCWAAVDLTTTFTKAAQRLLDAIDTLCDHTPRDNAPTWVAMQCYGEDRATMDLFHGPFRANTHKDAMAVLRAVAWAHNLPSVALFKTTILPKKAPLPLPLVVRFL